MGTRKKVVKDVDDVKWKKVDDDVRLSKENIRSLDHYFSIFPPKYLARNLRNIMVDHVSAFNGGLPLYTNELAMQLSSLLTVLDELEDDGQYQSADYDRNREFY